MFLPVCLGYYKYYKREFRALFINRPSILTLLLMLPDLQLNDRLRLRKQHPCGSYEWIVTRLGADIGLECAGCGRRVMLTRRELAKRLKTNLTKQGQDERQHDT